LLAAHDGDNQSFLSEDPFAGVADTPPSLHRYLYAYSNPTVFVDPTGREAEEKDELPASLRTPRIVQERGTGRLILVDPVTGQRLPDKPKEPEEEPSWWERAKSAVEKATDIVTENARELVAELKEWSSTVDEHTGSTPTSGDDEQDIATAQNARTGIGEVTEQTKDVVVAGARVADDASTAVQAASGAGAVVLIVKEGVQRYIQRRALKKALAEGWALAEEGGEAAARRALTTGAERATFRQVLTPEEAARFEKLKAEYPEWMPDLDDAARDLTPTEVKAARRQVRGPGHHPHPIAFGGEPNPPKGLVPTGETRKEKNPVHTEVTKFWNDVLRRVRSENAAGG
jgi:hypothetical protein